MPSIYSSQAQYSGANQGGFTAPAVNNYIEQGLGAIANGFNKAFEVQNKLDQARMADDLAEVNQQIDDAIANGSLDGTPVENGDYQSMLEPLMKKWDEVVEKASPIARTEFFNNNPKAREITAMKVGQRLLDQQQKYQAQRVETEEFSRWSTDMMLTQGNTFEETRTLQNAKQKAYEQTLHDYGFPPALEQKLLYKFRQDMDNARLDSWLMSKKYDQAEEALKRGDMLETIDARSRLTALKAIQDAVDAQQKEEERLAKERAKEAKDGAKAMETIEGNPEAAAIMEAFTAQVRSGNVEAAKRMRNDFFSGIGTIELDVRNKNTGKIEHLNIPLNTKNISSQLWKKMVDQMDGIEANSPNNKIFNTATIVDFNNKFKFDPEDPTNIDLTNFTPEAFALIENYINDKAKFNELTSQQRAFAVALYNDAQRATQNAPRYHDVSIEEGKPTVALYRPGWHLTNRINPATSAMLYSTGAYESPEDSLQRKEAQRGFMTQIMNSQDSIIRDKKQQPKAGTLGRMLMTIHAGILGSGDTNRDSFFSLLGGSDPAVDAPAINRSIMRHAYMMQKDGSLYEGLDINNGADVAEKMLNSILEDANIKVSDTDPTVTAAKKALLKRWAEVASDQDLEPYSTSGTLEELKIKSKPEPFAFGGLASK